AEPADTNAFGGAAAAPVGQAEAPESAAQPPITLPSEAAAPAGQAEAQPATSHQVHEVVTRPRRPRPQRPAAPATAEGDQALRDSAPQPGAEPVTRAGPPAGPQPVSRSGEAQPAPGAAPARSTWTPGEWRQRLQR